MRKNQYLYLGDKIGGKVYYAIQKNQFYWGRGIQNGWIASITAFTGTVFYIFTKKFKFVELNYNDAAYVVCSAVIGLLLSIIFQQYGVKSDEKYFSSAKPMEYLPKEQMEKILRQAGRLTMVYRGFRIFLVLLLIITPFLVREIKSMVVFFSYFVVWFVFGLLMQMNLRKRKKILRKIREKYMQE